MRRMCPATNGSSRGRNRKRGTGVLHSHAANAIGIQRPGSRPVVSRIKVLGIIRKRAPATTIRDEGLEFQPHRRYQIAVSR